MKDFSLSDVVGGFGRGMAALGTLGISEYQRGMHEDAATNRQELGRILSGQTIPAFARAGGAQPDSPENIRRAQLAQMAELGTPQAMAALGKLSPLAQDPQAAAEAQAKKQALGQLAPLVAKQYNISTDAALTMLSGGVTTDTLGKLQQPAQDLVQVYDAASGQMKFIPKSQAAGSFASSPVKPNLPDDIVKFEYEQNLKETNPALYETYQKSMGGGKLDPKDEAAIEKDLRKEYTTLNQDFRDITSSYKKIRAASPTAAGDLSLVFGFMKMLDPGSVVREGEFANAQNAAGVPERIKNSYNRVLEGTRLGTEQRTDFMTQAENIYKTQVDTARKYSNTYKGLAERANVDVDDVVLDFDEQIEPLKLESYTFNSEAEADAANLPIGTEIMINGRRAVIE